MGIKDLCFDKIKERAENFKRVAEKYPMSQFGIEPKAERFIEENSLAPIIGTICDQEITAEDAWEFPYWLNEKLKLKGKSVSAKSICELSKEELKELLRDYMKNKWPSGMSKSRREKYLNNISRRIIHACKFIFTEYNNEPDNMFKKGIYIVPEIYFLLRVIPGIGPKKATMIARDFAKGEGPWYKGICRRLKGQGINFKVEGKHLSEVPVDIHVVKVFGRVMGEFKNTPKREKFLDYWPDIQNFAKLAFPDFPGKIDEILWSVGREYCHERNPNCKNCPLKDIPCEFGMRRSKP